MDDAKTKRNKNKGWRSKSLSKLSNNVSKLKSKKNIQESNNITCTETNEITTSTDRTDVRSSNSLKRYGDSLRNMLESRRQMGWLSFTTITRKSRDNNSDTNTTTTKLPADESESQVKCEGATKEYVSQGSLTLEYDQEHETGRLSSLEDPVEYGRQMGWLPISTGRSSDDDNNNNSDANTTTNLLPADENESETKPKSEGAKKEYVGQETLEYHQEHYLQMEMDINTTLRTQTAIESVAQKKNCVVRPSALDFGRQMGWVP